MLAVVEAARALIARYRDQAPHAGLGPLAQVLSDTLAALDAHTEADAETVTRKVVRIRGCIGVNGDDYYAYGSHSEPDDELQAIVIGADYEPVCMFEVDAPANPPALPTIPAAVTREGGR